MPRAEVSFESGGERCAAWLYLPDGEAERHGCVILGHGFSMVREARLDAYAERFVAAGLAAFAFDYRHFGASDGHPRQLLSLSAQLADWHAAIRSVRGLEEIDAGRIALWGTSLSGGHVVAVAAADPAIAAVVSQIPFTGLERHDGPLRLKFLTRMVGSALLDELAGGLGREPYYIPVAADPGTFAAYNHPDAVGEIGSIVPGGSTWENRITPRVMLRVKRYRPWDDVADVRCPLLVCVADHDTITPAGPAIAAAARAPLGELRRYPIGHFDIYRGDWFEQAVADQTDFLRACLGAGFTRAGV